MLWVDKKKALNYFSVSAPLAEAQNNQELISTTKVIQNFQNPKIEARNPLITPEMDASYLKAVERKRKGGVFLEVNEIETLYPKKSRGIISWINKKLLCNG